MTQLLRVVLVSVRAGMHEVMQVPVSIADIRCHEDYVK